ncbi:MAG: hypothetical protein FWG41_05375, partial [Methanomassiliicoccaceae archaeon]|nr:hypothetical protein [Methanomassiliicoccaceae archaeon]
MGKMSEGIMRKVPKPATYLRSVINLDEETKHDKLDKLIIKIFPPFVIACAVLTVFLTIYLGNYSFTGILFGICLGFVLGFTALGIACVILSDKGVIGKKYVLPAALILPALVSVLLYIVGSDIGFNEFIVKYFDIFGKNTDLVSILISVYTLTLVVLFVAYGVVSVIVGFFRSYFYRVLRSLEYPPDKRKNRIPEWLFQIPDIIDIESVVLEPDTDDERFNFKLFTSTAFSL